MDPVTIAIISAVFGGTSASVGTVNLIRQFRKVDAQRATRDALQQYKKLTSESKNHHEEDILLDSLTLAEVISGPLRTKLLNRFLLSLGAIVGCFTLTLPHFSDDLSRIQQLGWPILIVGAVQFVAGLAALWPPLLLNADERAFLGNLRVLHEWFYNAYVPEAIVSFNNAVSRSPKFRSEIAQEGLRTDRLREKVKTLFESFQGFSGKE